jgi:hypothetical protein
MAQVDEENHNHGDDLGLFGDDDEQEQHYNDVGDLDDILGLDDEDVADTMPDPEGALLMKFCPHDSSMLYPKVRGGVATRFVSVVVHDICMVYFFYESLSHQNKQINTTSTTSNLNKRKIEQNANCNTHAASAAIPKQPTVN